MAYNAREATVVVQGPPCPFYAVDICKLGAQCQYSHPTQLASSATSTSSSTLAGQSSRTNQSIKTRPQADAAEAEFRLWSRSIPSDPNNAPMLHAGLGRFFTQAHKLASGKPGITQQVVTALASEGGMKRIAELVNRPFDSWGDALLIKVFAEQIIPFFQLLCLPNVDRSVLLEARVAGLYTYLFGSNGQRAVCLFTAAARCLNKLVQRSAGNDLKVAMECSTAVFSKVDQINATAAVTEPLKELVETFTGIIEPPIETPSSSRLALRDLRKLQRHLQLGEKIPTGENRPAVPHMATYVHQRDLPGEDSINGPRHDNDHKHIGDIKIMPTIEEIRSSRNEYLPGLDPTEWHLEGMAGLLDRHFRLLREDTVGQLRDATKFELDRQQNPVAGTLERQHRGARTSIYKNVQFENFGFDPIKGLEFAVSFDQPYEIRGHHDNVKLWAESKRLGSDALVCLIDASSGSATFMTVSLPPDERSSKSSAKGHGLHKKYPRAGDHLRAHAVVRFVEINKATAGQVLGFFYSTWRHAEMSLVEFPGILVPAFQPTLGALQDMSSNLDVPFADILLQANTTIGEHAGDIAHVDPPAYATAEDFRYDLSAVSTIPMSLKLGEGGKPDGFDMDPFKQSTSLDPRQAEALIASLTHSFAITQGPPGTGKSYTGIGLIKVLLDNKARGDLGPILLVAYTNHALHQLLEHLLDAGVGQVIRIGSRSQSERISQLNLKIVAQKAEHTKTERAEQYQLKKDIAAEGNQMLEALQEINVLASPANIEAYLARVSPDHYEQLFGKVDDEGFEIVDHHTSTILPRWLQGILYPPQADNGEDRTVEELDYLDLRQMSIKERRTIYHHWIRTMEREVHDRLASALENHGALKRRLNTINGEIDLRVLSTANIIGMTTSGLARQLPLLRKLPSKVLVSEEAGEVLEAHLLTAMLPSLEHVILIGDHLQLRPQVKNYELSSESTEGKQYCLDISLFERLVKPITGACLPLPFSTLDTQRRMHPSISRLIRSTLYPSLKDAPDVSDYPEVQGFRRRLFWLTHDHPECSEADEAQSASKTNYYEAEMTAALVSHLVRQGAYKPSEVAVLTPYLGQVRLLRRKLKCHYEITLSDGDVTALDEAFEDDAVHNESEQKAPPSKITRGTLMDAVRLSTVDNFQGEEAKVVIISLVRCNDQLTPGFLRTENRCNVLLSRAKHGMYIIGNAETAATAPMWKQVLEMLSPDDVGDKLPLCYPRHPEKIIEVSEPEQLIEVAPAGGCKELCARKLANCGHSCPQHCHSDMLHDEVFCTKDCFRPVPGCEKNHSCPNRCGDDCPERCEVPIVGWSLELECGHILKDLPCWMTEELEDYQCSELVSRTIPGCNHQILLPCHVDHTTPGLRCESVCGAELPCGHICKKACKDCNVRTSDDVAAADHSKCETICGRLYSLCRHSCKAACHGDEPCPACDNSCEVHCAHSQCGKPCKQPCVPCAEAVCPSECEHTSCQMPCAAPCDWVPCSLRCSKILSCGCRCPTVCGEACPSSKYCQNCGDHKILEQVADFVLFSEYEDIDLDKSPVVVLDCGHVYCIDTLDRHMNMKMHYQLDADGRPIAVKAANAIDYSKEDLKVCISCRGSMRNIARYGRIVRRALLDESTKKFITWSNSEYIPIAQRLFKAQENLATTVNAAKLITRAVRLEGQVNDQIAEIRSKQGYKRYGEIFRIRRVILDFVEKVSKTEQPFQRYGGERLGTRKCRPSTTTKAWCRLGQLCFAHALLLRGNLTIITDVLKVREQTPPEVNGENSLVADFTQNRLNCETLINDAVHARQIVQEAEGHILWAHFAAVERAVSPAAKEGRQPEGTSTDLKLAAQLHLEAAVRICAAHPNETRVVSQEMETMQKMLRDMVFYSPVASEELKAVVEAMAAEFEVTGHWYRCAEGHLFTIGECGRPMQTSSCPQCGSPVGGNSHQPAVGVMAADDVANTFGNMAV